MDKDEERGKTDEGGWTLEGQTGWPYCYWGIWTHCGGIRVPGKIEWRNW